MVIYVKIIGMSCRNLSFNNILYHISSLHSHLIDITQLKKITFTCEDIMKIYIYISLLFERMQKEYEEPKSN